MHRAPLRLCVPAGLCLALAARSAAADPIPTTAAPPVLDLLQLCAAGAPPATLRCVACTPRATATLCALRRGGFSPFAAESIADSGDFRRVSGYVLAGAAVLLAAGAAVTFAVAYGDRTADVGFNPLLFVGGFGLALGSLGTGIAAPLLVRSGDKRLEAAELLRALGSPPRAAPGPAIHFVRHF